MTASRSSQRCSKGAAALTYHIQRPPSQSSYASINQHGTSGLLVGELGLYGRVNVQIPPGRMQMPSILSLGPFARLRLKLCHGACSPGLKRSPSREAQRRGSFALVVAVDSNNTWINGYFSSACCAALALEQPMFE
jgi:hypothetical protein